MAKILTLESASIRECLLGAELYHRWDLELAIWAWDSDLRDQGNRTSKVVEDYMVQRATYPLLAEVAHPQA